MNEQIWTQWVNDWKRILEIAEKRNWDREELVIKPTLDSKAVAELEKELGITYPAEFKEVLTTFSSAVLLNWQIENEETEGEFDGIFCGGGHGYLWDFDTLKTIYEDYLSWLKECFTNPEDEYDKIWYNKVPFLNVPNGDFIVFDTTLGLENSPVIYLSHDDSNMHGYRLAENFIEFITRWSNLGCVGTEDWQLEPFYDEEEKKLKARGPIVARWKQWLEK